MMQKSQIVDKPHAVLQEIDLIALLSESAGGDDAMLIETRESIAGVFRKFMASQDHSDDRVSVIDGFLFVFNEPRFFKWYTFNWWEQRKYIQAIKDHPSYTGRAHALLAHSHFAPYLGYSDDMVAKSTDKAVKQAWMRKRLVMKECFWNAIDSISHAAYYQEKYQNLFPALCVLLCNVIDRNGRECELVLGIDNGTGFLYKKKSRESAMINLFYKVYKLFFRRGVFYIGGLELGLQETDGKLSCHGSGAVVYQGW
ncbi:MAG: hypothetical protein WBG28_03590 [Desulfobulbales bacterium]